MNYAGLNKVLNEKMKSTKEATEVKTQLRTLIMLCHFGVVVAFILTQMLSTLYFVAKDY